MHSGCSHPYPHFLIFTHTLYIPLHFYGAPSHIPFLLFSLYPSEFDQDHLYGLVIKTVHWSLAGTPVATHQRQWLPIIDGSLYLYVAYRFNGKGKVPISPSPTITGHGEGLSCAVPAQVIKASMSS